jgi:hypothetical protein
MIGNQEPLFPPHKDCTTISILHGQIRSFGFMLDMFEGWKTGPMHKVFVLRGTPILGDETISTSNNLGIKICGEFWPVIGQTTNAKITTEGRRRKVNVLLNIF